MNKFLILSMLLAAPAAYADRTDATSTWNDIRRFDAAGPAVKAPAPMQLAQADDGRFYDDPDYDVESYGTLPELEDQIEQLRDYWRANRYPAPDLDLAEDYVDRLSTHSPGSLPPDDLDRAQDLIDDARDEALDHLRGRGGDEREGIVIDSGDDELAREEVERAREEAARAREDAEAQREAALAAQREAEDERGRYAELQSELSQMQTRETERGLVVTLGDVLFAVGRVDLKASAVRTLAQLVSSMREHADTTVLIEGHTDSTGARKYNYQLSERRANTVQAFLTRNGIAARRIQARGLGPDSPVASNKTSAGRQQNRRVELIMQDEAERAERKRR